MEDIIKSNYDIAMSLEDIQRVCCDKVKVIVYTDLVNYETIDEILYPYGVCILLVQWTNNFGHWVCILRVDDNTIEQFDSYGCGFDRQYDRQNPLGLSNDLSRLFLNSQYMQVIFNKHKFQSSEKGINTCGRWAVIRALMKNYSLEHFTSLFHNQVNSGDFLVTALTLFAS